jgi:PAS domain S-box-containing protein
MKNQAHSVVRCFRKVALIARNGGYLVLLTGWLLQSGGYAAENPELTVSAGCEVDYPPFCIVHSDGRSDGFAVELLRAALNKMDYQVTFRTGVWSSVRSWLERGEVQVLPLVGRTPEREPLFDFTFPFMTMHGAIVVRKDMRNVHQLSDLKGCTVGVMQGDNAEEFLRRGRRDFGILATPTYLDTLRALQSGQCDAVVLQRLVAVRLLAESGLHDLRIVERPIREFAQDFCFAVQKGDSQMLSLLNEGLALVMADGTHRHLHDKWFAHLQLPHDRPIIVGGDHNYPPFEFLDETGRPAGFSVELTQAIAREAGLNVRIRLEPWQSVVNGLHDGSVDALEGIFYTPERDALLDFSPKYIVVDCVSVVRKDAGNPPVSFEELRGRELVVQAEDAMFNKIMEHGLDQRIIVVKTQEEVVRTIAEGRGDCGLVTRLSTLYTIRKHGYTNLKVAEKALYSGQYCYAVLNGNDALLTKFTEGLQVVKNSGEYQRLYEKWMGVYERHLSIGEVIRYVASVALPLLLLVLLVLLWSWTLRRRVAARTYELSVANRQMQESNESLLKIQETLRRSDERFSLAQALSGVGAWEWNLSTNEVYWSDKLMELFGFAEDKGKFNESFDSVTECIYPDDVSAWRDSVRECVEDGREHCMEYRVLLPDGRLRWIGVFGNAQRDDDGKAIRLVGVAMDVTERKLAEQALKEAYEIINRSFSVAFTWRNAEGWPVEFASENVLKLLGHKAEDFTEDRVSYLECVHPDDLLRVKREFAAVFADRNIEEMVHEPYRLTAKDGTLKVVRHWTFVIRNNEGRVTHFKGIVEDITSQRNLENQLAQSQKMEAVGRLAGGVAHDYNNMLNVIMGYTELAMENEQLREPLREYLQEIAAAANRSKAITEQLLAFARRETIAPQLMDMNTSVTKMLAIIRKLIGENIELSWYPGEGALPVLLDPSQLDQILVNLCVNARDAVEDVGRITIETSNVKIDNDYCTTHADFIPGDFVQLVVSDDGVGMDNETLEHIFEPFFTTKKIGEGTGLGLPMVYGIVKQNHGFINVYSEIGRGTTFRIYLPRQMEETPEENQKLLAQPFKSGRGITVLVVEDEESILKLTDKILSRCEYDVLTADSPANALEIARSYPGEIVLLITDVVMPEMNGKELADQLRRQYPALKCLFMSGYTANVIVQRGVLKKGVDFIQKPFAVKTFIQKVNEVLNKSGD